MFEEIKIEVNDHSSPSPIGLEELRMRKWGDVNRVVLTIDNIGKQHLTITLEQ